MMLLEGSFEKLSVKIFESLWFGIFIGLSVVSKLFRLSVKFFYGISIGKDYVLEFIVSYMMQYIFYNKKTIECGLIV